MTARNRDNDCGPEAQLPERFKFLIIADRISQFFLAEIVEQFGCTCLENTDDRQCVARKVFGTNLDLLREILLLGIDVGDQRRADLVTLERKINKAPVGKRRNREPRDVDQRTFVVQRGGQHRAGFSEESRPALGGLRFSARGFGTDKLFTLLFGAFAFSNVVAGKDEMAGC